MNNVNKPEYHPFSFISACLHLSSKIFFKPPCQLSILGLRARGRERKKRNLMLRRFFDENTMPSVGKGFRCLICQKELANYDKCRKHMRDIHWAAGPSFVCPEDNCQKTNTSRNAFAAHMQRNHPEWKGVPLDTFIKE